MEELQEAEVMWGDYHFNQYHHHPKTDMPESQPGRFVLQQETEPVNIPAGKRRSGEELVIGQGDEEEGGKMVPPHVVIKRRSAGKMTFSVCSGQGRTLKGRDLSQLRNSVLRMTGFLEG